MSPLERLRWAIAPVQERSTTLLWSGIALFVASGGLSVLFEVTTVMKLLLYAGMLAGWVVAALGITGYLRCLYGQATAEMRRVHSERMKDE